MPINALMKDWKTFNVVKKLKLDKHPKTSYEKWRAIKAYDSLHSFKHNMPKLALLFEEVCLLDNTGRELFLKRENRYAGIQNNWGSSCHQSRKTPSRGLGS